MKYNHILLSMSLLLTFLTTPAIAHADVSNHAVTQKVSRQVALSHINQHIITKTWHVTHLTKLQQKLNNNCKTYLVGNANPVDANQRPIPWMGNHTLIQDSNHNITYYLNPSNGAQYNESFQKAIDTWNNLNVIHLVPTDDYHQAAVILATNQTIPQSTPDNTTIPNDYIHPNDDFTTWAGVTFTKNTTNDTHDVVLFNADIDNPDDVHANQLTAEHEIGHALGFAHDTYSQDTVEVEQSYHYSKPKHTFTEEIDTTTLNHQAPIMNPGAGVSIDSYIQLGQPEANALRQHYLN